VDWIGSGSKPVATMRFWTGQMNLDFVRQSQQYHRLQMLQVDSSLPMRPQK